jgi:AcrR family transcriptional regulator
MSISAKETRVDPRVKRTLKLLQRAFAELMAEKDFENLTVQDIVDRAEINRATFYLHFEDKFALLSYLVREAMRESIARRPIDERGFTPGNVRLLAEATVEFFEHYKCHPSDRDTTRMLVALDVQQYLYDVLLEWIENARMSGARESVSPEGAAMTLSFVMAGLPLRRGRNNRAGLTDDQVDQMLEFLEPSLRAYFVAGSG